MLLSSIVIDCDDVKKLSEFYQRLLGWEKKIYDHGKNGIWVTLKSKKESTTRLVFQQIENYERPIWPEEKGKQQQMMHMDFYSHDVEKDVEHALELGATLSKYQSGDWRVLLDSMDHPFCIVPTRKR